MKNIKGLLLVVICGLTLPLTAQNTKPITYKKQITDWARKHPLLYNIAYLQTTLGLGLSAGWLYARIFIPQLLSKKYADSSAGIQELITDMQSRKTSAHMLGAIASTVGTVVGMRFTFLQDIFNKSSAKHQLLAGLSLLPTALVISTLARSLN